MASINYFDFFKGNIDKLSRACKSVEEDKEQRKLRFKRPPVVTFESSSEEVIPVAPGTITLFLARHKMSTLEDLKESLNNKNISRITHLIEQMYNDHIKVQHPDIEEIPKQVRKEVLIDLYYESKLLRPNIALSGTQNFFLFPLPYNGGKLHEDKFELREWYNFSQEGDEQENQLNSLLVIRPPRVTPAERKALDMVPDDKTTLNLGYLGNLENVTIVGGIVTGGIRFDPLEWWSDPRADTDRMDKVTVEESRIKELGPAASAQYLTALRSKLLSSNITGSH